MQSKLIYAIRAIVLCAGVFAALSATAQSDPASRRPSAEEIVRQLKPVEAAPEAPAPDSGVRTRSFRGVVVENRPAPAPAAPPSIDLEVNFEYNSAKLTPDARIILNNLGQALGDPALAASKFRIAGHTDARGSDDYNQKLSQARAESVAQYLIKEHNVTADRLDVKGYGRTQLLDAANPASAVNRRVQVVNLGTGQ